MAPWSGRQGADLEHPFYPSVVSSVPRRLKQPSVFPLKTEGVKVTAATMSHVCAPPQRRDYSKMTIFAFHLETGVDEDPPQ